MFVASISINFTLYFQLIKKKWYWKPVSFFVARFQSPQVDINNFDLLPFSILVGCLKPMSTTVQGSLWQVGNLKFLEIN